MLIFAPIKMSILSFHVFSNLKCIKTTNNMKNQYLFLFLATLMALTASSCKKDPVSPDPEIPEAATVTLNAEIQKPFNGYDKDTFCWLNGDEVYINNAVYPIMDASGTSVPYASGAFRRSFRRDLPSFTHRAVPVSERKTLLVFGLRGGYALPY